MTVSKSFVLSIVTISFVIQGISIDAIEAQSEVDCWSKCKDTDGCAWYSFFTTKGYCYLLQNCPIINEEFVDFTGGEVTCQFGTTTSMPTISTTLSPDKGYSKLTKIIF